MAFIHSAYGDVRDYRQLMRKFVIDISLYGKSQNPDFIVIPQNGHELMSRGVEGVGPAASEYITAVDGAGQEDLFYGYRSNNRATPVRETDYMSAYLDLAREHGVVILVTDYCRTPGKMNDSFEKNRGRGYVSFAAPERELNVIPNYPHPIRNVNDRDIERLGDAGNFLYLINPGNWDNVDVFIRELRDTAYDLLILDLFFEDDGGAPRPLRSDEVHALKQKPGGGKRLVVSYMSIGEAEDYRYYWQQGWRTSPPVWLGNENPNWPGNYKVHYWDEGWRRIILGGAHSYLDRIIEAGFDGVYLDLISAFEYFEEREQ
jgi:cysteinyl-tRNA synthetase